MYVKCHRICGAATGFLSTFAWYVMALHVLLRFEYLPSNLLNHVYNDVHAITEREQLDLFHFSELPIQYVTKIQTTSLFELLDRFFRYYVEDIDLFSKVITLRDGGKLLAKADWSRPPVLWRMSIEVSHCQ
jgi:hypothetical protein